MRCLLIPRRETISVRAFCGSSVITKSSQQVGRCSVDARKRSRREAGDSSSKNRRMASRSDTSRRPHAGTGAVTEHETRGGTSVAVATSDTR